MEMARETVKETAKETNINLRVIILKTTLLDTCKNSPPGSGGGWRCLNFLADSMRMLLPRLPPPKGFAQRIALEEPGPKYAIGHSPIANLEHPCAISLKVNLAAPRIAKDSAEGCSKLAMGEC